MPGSRFVYVIHIRTTPEKLWDALTKPEFTRQYWGHDNVSDWKPGSAWEHRDAGSGNVRLIGEVLESRPPHRLVITWVEPKDKANRDRHSRVAFDIEAVGSMVRLTVTHDELEPGSQMDTSIRVGWPRVLSSLKSLLETGKPLQTWASD